MISLILTKVGDYMLIGNQYSDNKIYRGIRHYDSLPLTSEDIHEYSDTLFMKTAYIMNNIIGYGILNSPNIVISSSDIKLVDPAVLLIDGDISLINSDDNTSIITSNEMKSAGYSSGALCIVGWYQSLTANSTLRNYGGVKNSILPNDLIDSKFNVQVSSRYQFRWTTIILDSNDVSENSIYFNLLNRDATGELTSGSSSITSYKKTGNTFLASRPSTMDYALSDLYIIPLLKYEYDTSSNSILGATAYLPVTPKGSSGFIKSDSEPVGEFTEGTTWYNPITREFRTYVAGVGFVDSTSSMGFLQYQSVYNFSKDFNTPQDITIPVNISELEEGDILQVVYEGLTLTATEHYTIDYENHTVTLLGFTANSGDKVTFTSTKIVEASDITNITTTFTTHMSMTGSEIKEGHLKLSDDIDSTSGVNKGIAATPKAVRDSKMITDSTTGNKYKFGVDNGLLYIEEM